MLVIIFFIKINKSCSTTPGATLRDCRFLLPGFVSDRDMTFALRIISEANKPNEAGKKQLARAIVTYFESPVGYFLYIYPYFLFLRNLLIVSSKPSVKESPIGYSAHSGGQIACLPSTVIVSLILE
jgi:hypothetical protein